MSRSQLSGEQHLAAVFAVEVDSPPPPLDNLSNRQALPTAAGPRAIAHIAYELAVHLDREPGVDNIALLDRVDWILQVLGRQPDVLSTERQRGLIGECILLVEILRAGRAIGVSAEAVLERWKGPEGGKRDFTTSEVAIEVKTTAQNARLHHVDSLEQLAPAHPDEELLLFSVGIKTDPSFGRTLPVFIADVESHIVDSVGKPNENARETFRLKLASAGYHQEFESSYSSMPGHHPNPALPPKAFKVADLDVLSVGSFKNDSLPSMVRQVSYQLELATAPLPDHRFLEAIHRLLLSPL